MRPTIRAAVPAALVLTLAAGPRRPPGRRRRSRNTGRCRPDECRPGRSPAPRLVTPTDIDLSWRAGASGAAGHVLEFATEEAGPYTVLEYLPPGTTTYRHPDLIPRTTFFYRLRAFQGPASPRPAAHRIRRRAPIHRGLRESP
ncbi:hypothetical protein ACWGDX_39155 [Streptomyces sp. NPDC055025]